MTTTRAERDADPVSSVVCLLFVVLLLLFAVELCSAALFTIPSSSSGRAT